MVSSSLLVSCGIVAEIDCHIARSLSALVSNDNDNFNKILIEIICIKILLILSLPLGPFFTKLLVLTTNTNNITNH